MLYGQKFCVVITTANDRQRRILQHHQRSCLVLAAPVLKRTRREKKENKIRKNKEIKEGKGKGKGKEKREKKKEKKEKKNCPAKDSNQGTSTINVRRIFGLSLRHLKMQRIMSWYAGPTTPPGLFLVC